MADDIVTFGIPLISRAAARDWNVVQRQLNATIGSIYNQTDPNFRIVIACSDLPELTVATDERLTVIRCEQQRQLNRHWFNLDAAHKRYAIAQHMRGFAPGYLMHADADDLISSKVVAFIRADRDPNGYVVSRGYIFDAAQGVLSPFPFEAGSAWRFDDECGTCSAVHFTPEELPPREGGGSSRYARLMADGHPGTRHAALRESRPLSDFPFRAVTYVKNTGENLSVRRSKVLEVERLEFQARLEDNTVRHRIARTPELDAEFNLKAAEAPSRSSVAGVDRFGLGLSVAIVTHKRPAGLRRLLEALRPQVEGRSDREIIVVNDGTHDTEYQAVAAEFRTLMRYVALPENVGIADARNHSFSSAQGEYIVFTDDDCVPPAWWLDWLTARLLKSPEIDVIAGTTLPNWSTRGFFERVQAHFRSIPYPRMSGDSVAFVTACLAIRRTLLRQEGGFGYGSAFPGAGEDTELALRLGWRGARAHIDWRWHVLHDLDSLTAQVRRNWRYGRANVVISDLTVGARAYAQARQARRRRHPANAWRTFGALWRESDGFSKSRVVRLAAALAALPVRIAYYDGCAFSSGERRTPRPLAVRPPNATKAGA